MQEKLEQLMTQREIFRYENSTQLQFVLLSVQNTINVS